MESVEKAPGSETPWRLAFWVLVALFVGLTFGICAPSKELNCRFSCQGDARGFTYEVGKCECIR